MTPRLTYTSPIPSPERILLYGPEGTGKSTAPLTIADRIPNAHFHILDIDYTENYERLIQTAFPRVAERGNYTVHELDPEDWQEIIRVMETTMPEVGVDDWWVVDSATHLWSAVQAWYTEAIWGKDLADYFVDLQIAAEKERSRARNTGKGAKAEDDDDDEGKFNWQVVNAQYGHWRRVFKKVKGHILFTAEAKELPKKARGKEQIRDSERYGHIGLKPAGQKQLGYMPHTVLYMSVTAHDQYEITTVKDRGREKVDHMAIDMEDGKPGFVADYLVKVAGWKAGVLHDE